MSLKAAWAWLLALCAVGLVVLLQLRGSAQLVALASLALVAAYPFMKRITWWPQAWLGLVFTWGALVGWTALRRTGSTSPALLLYAGSIFWCSATTRSTRCRTARTTRWSASAPRRCGSAVTSAAASACSTRSRWPAGRRALAGPAASRSAFVALCPPAIQLVWQVLTLQPGDGGDALAKFRSNRFAGLLVFLACASVGTGAV